MAQGQDIDFDEVKASLVVALRRCHAKDEVITDVKGADDLVHAMRILDRHGRHWCDKMYDALDDLDRSPAQDYIFTNMVDR